MKIRRLVICGVCFKPDCPFSYWVDEDGDPNFVSDEISDALHEISKMVLDEAHEKLQSKQFTPAEIASKIEEVKSEYEDMTGDTIEVATRLEDFLDAPIAPTNYDGVKTQDDGFLNSLLNPEQAQESEQSKLRNRLGL